MKAKIKNPEIAQQKGFDVIKKLLKKLLKEPNTEVQQFLYDTEFAYGGKDGVQPLLYIGELTAKWKKYAKENKASKTFVAGECIIENGEIKMVPKTGKGAKAAVIKVINKDVLKPFASALFVESIDKAATTVATADETATAPTTASFDLENFKLNANNVSRESQRAKEELESVVNALAAPLKDIKSTIISDDLITKAKEAIQTIQQYDVQSLIKELQKWLNDAQPLKKEQGAAAIIKEIEQLKGALIKIAPQLAPIQQNATKLEKVQNPLESEVLPVSEEPLDDLFNSMTKVASASSLKTIAEQVAKVGFAAK